MHCTMSKITRILSGSLVILLIFGTWFYGSLIVIRIDSNQFTKFERLDSRNKELRQNIDKYCLRLEKENIIKDTLKMQLGIGDPSASKKKEALVAWDRARRDKLIRENLIYIPQLEQMWCLVPKAASTSWSKAIVDRLNLEEMAFHNDLNSTDSLQVILRQHFGSINKTTFIGAVRSEKVKKILLVRHPFSRVASAYQDKLADRKAKVDGMHFFQRFGAEIYRKYRQNRKLVKQKEPTFEEFIDYLISTKALDYDEHWKPISLLCGMCHVRYDHVIMAEDLQVSADFHLERLGFPKGYHLSKENNLTNGERHRSRQHFRNISNSKKIKILKKYQDDFRLFQYSFLDHYLS